MKNFNGKAIYNPAGKAGEYSPWACNFYVGCSNECEYCYCKKGILKPVMGQDTPQLKKHFRDEAHALQVFVKELDANLSELQKHGLFFSFTTDPMLALTSNLTWQAVGHAITRKVPCVILTKCADFADSVLRGLLADESVVPQSGKDEALRYIAFGFTLTGHDEMERGASTNAERITAMKALHTAGFRTWASIEPIVDFQSSLKMIMRAANFCDHFKIGLMSGKKYPMNVLYHFILDVGGALDGHSSTVYFKDSIMSQVRMKPEEMPKNTVSRDFNIFKV
jgi:DNA repair photolyase